MQNELLTIKTLIAVTLADIDVFLLQDETQTKDLDKVYTKEEIRSQLEQTAEKLSNTLTDLGYNIDIPLKKV